MIPKNGTGFPSRQTRSVCAAIMRKRQKSLAIGDLAHAGGARGVGYARTGSVAHLSVEAIALLFEAGQ
jgi:hypothetical protein